MIFFFFGKKITLLIQVSNTINRNTKSKVLKTLKDDAISKLIAKMIGSMSMHKKMFRILKIQDLQHTNEHDFI